VVEQDVLSRLIAGVYDAALRPELWNSALTAISDALGGAGLNIPVIDAAQNARFFLGTTRLDPDCGERFLNNPIYVQPSSSKWMPGLTASPVGTVVFREEMWTDREYRMSPIFNDIIRPQKLWHWAFAPLILEPDLFVPIGVLRAAGPTLFDAEDRNLMSRLLPHLVRALQVSLRLDTLRAKAASMEALIDRLPIGVILVDDDGGVMQTNPAAGAILSAGDGLKTSRGHLATAISAETTTLRRLIAEAARAARVGDSQSGGAMSASRPSGQRAFAILVAPLRTEASVFETRHASAVVFVSDPELKPRVPMEFFASVYQLTPRQAALAQRLAEGHTLDSAAEALGISRNTARSHLRLIFDKTGGKRQTELTRLLYAGSIVTNRF
jgi:DNA-binding CsgD family transcriptional regulator/PAS domain-containing protein